MLRPANRKKMLSLLPKGGVVAEVGVLQGAYSRHLRSLLEPSRLFLIDAWLPVGKWYGNKYDQAARFRAVVRHFLSDPSVYVLRADSTTAALCFPNDFFDVVYVDADHYRPKVDCDLEAYWPRIKPGGWLMGHDYHPRRFGVKAAVHAFIRKHDVALDLLTTQEEFASFGIRKPGGEA